MREYYTKKGFTYQLELLSYAELTEKEEKQINYFLNSCTIIDINNQIKSEVIKIRKEFSLKLPDCIVAATALFIDIPILKSDSDFKKIKELNLMFYEK